MNARTINSADSTENISRSDHTGAAAAPTSEAINRRKVEATCHQLFFVDSIENGRVAFKRSRPVRASDVASGESLATFRTFSSISDSAVLYT